MRQMLFDGPGKVRWEEVEEPALASPDAALVRPLAVATCDLDVATLRGVYPMAPRPSAPSRSNPSLPARPAPSRSPSTPAAARPVCAAR